ncbi:hypothetical protein R1flu_016868 [Riccia fluitans]|uniref:Uncharacterized protein n=1 Tax=Riccia fluitans TaxID=41844 RepID=A0ABD1YRZ8_9MARC
MVQAKEVSTAETLAKAPEEEEVPAITKSVLDEDDPNSEVKPKQRTSKQRQSSPKSLMDKPKSRKKMKMPKRDTIDLSDDKQQKVKREEETVLAKLTLQAPETDVIENFRISMVYGEQVVVPIL